MQIRMNLPQNFIWSTRPYNPKFYMVNKTIQRVSVPNLKFFGPIKTELWAKEVGDFSFM